MLNSLVYKDIAFRYSECTVWANSADSEFAPVKTSTTETNAGGVLMFGKCLLLSFSYCYVYFKSLIVVQL